MTRRASLKHQFVEFIPEDLSEDTLYISIRFATASHLCCCGCRNKVVTPLHPAGWKLIFDGKTVSLSPSVGNWSFPCKSHYWIRANRVQWVEQWSDERIAAARVGNQRETGLCDASLEDTKIREPRTHRPAKRGIWSKLKDRFRLR
jgi:hypothetical protein